MKCCYRIEGDFEALAGVTDSMRPGGVFVVHDRAVEEAADAVAGLCSARSMMSIEGGEASKTMETVLDICRFLAAMNADRDSILIGVGGGVTTDLTALAASLYKRGIRFILVPTTLLAQVDAAIGGKNAVDLDGLKNILGTLRQPELTYIVPSVLDTLPPQEMGNGLAELLKTFLVGDNAFYLRALDLFRAGRRPSAGEMEPLIAAAAGIKTAIVEKDFEDRGERHRLNLGHTFAHAIETVSGGEIPHGRAVSMGIIFAARLSEETGTAPEGLAERLKRDFESVGLPTECPFGRGMLERAIANDKKNRGGEPHYVLIKEPGQTVI